MQSAEDIIRYYEESKKQYGADAFRYILEILREAEPHYRNFIQENFPSKNVEQSWHSVKGNALEILVKHIIEESITSIGLKIVSGITLEKRHDKNLDDDLLRVKQNLVVNLGDNGFYMPDADIIVFHPTSCRVLAVLSIKSSMRERIAQTVYWKLKLLQDDRTSHIKVYFLTPNSDSDFQLDSRNKRKSKPHAIAEADTDGIYILNTRDIVSSSKVKTFDSLISDLKSLISPS